MLASAPSRSYPLGPHLYHMIRCVHALFAQSTVKWLFPLTEQSSYTRDFCVCWNSEMDYFLSSRESSKQKESMSKLSSGKYKNIALWERYWERRKVIKINISYQWRQWESSFRGRQLRNPYKRHVHFPWMKINVMMLRFAKNFTFLCFMCTLAQQVL